MATNKGGFSKSQAKQLVKDIEAELATFSKHLTALSEDLNTLQKGDGTTAYWSGERAYAWIKTALEHVKHDDELLENLEAVKNALDLIVNGAASM